jgi:hypothetical protein
LRPTGYRQGSRQIEQLAGGRGFGFALERAVFASVLHRLVISGSDRACGKWLDAYHIDGTDGLELHQLDRAMAWLGEELTDQGGATRAATHEGSNRGGAVRTPAQPVQRSLRGAVRHHLR